MNYAIDIAWERSSRGFWTKRKKTATSLLAVLSLIAGMAVAYKLFDQSIPNNVVRDAASFDFEVWKFEELAGDTDFENTANGTPVYESHKDNGDPIETFPTETREVEVKIINTNTEPSQDASFFVYIDQDAFEVTGCYASDGTAIPVDENGNCEEGATTTEPTIVPPDGVTEKIWLRFVNFWTLDVQKEKVLGTPAGEVNEDDHTGQNLLDEGNDEDGDPDNHASDPSDDSGNRQYSEACSSGVRALRSTSQCDLGMIRAAGTRDAAGEQLDLRYYIFGLTEIDDGDQSPFKGWTLSFDLVFQARVPALPESSTPVYER